EAAPNVLWAGKPYPFVDARLSADGELLVKGPNVFPGYWRNEAATWEAFTADGWLRTGDVAEVDEDGCYRIKGRLKDMFVSGGENVYPAEVESVLHEHRAVRDSAVVGVADDRWGEVGIAFVVVDRDTTEDELLAHCRERLARFKVPKAVRDLNRRVRHAMKEASAQGGTRLEAELLGFAAYFRFTSEHTALYRIIRQAEFVSPEMLHYHYDRLSEGYVEALQEATAAGEAG